MTATHKQVWDNLDKQNGKLLGEPISTTMDLVDGLQDQYLLQLSPELQDFYNEQVDNDSDTFLMVQAATMDMEELRKEVESEFKNPEMSDRQLAILWHLLHSEQ